MNLGALSASDGTKTDRVYHFGPRADAGISWSYPDLSYWYRNVLSPLTLGLLLQTQ